jgi:hypothetical protein
MISPAVINARKEFYHSAVIELTNNHRKPPTVQETILYMAMMLKEDPIELAIEIYKLEAERKKHET